MRMLSQNTTPLNEEKEYISGFHVLSNGSFIEVLPHKIKILSGISRESIDIKGAPETHGSMVTLIAELPNQHVALAYCPSKYDHRPHLLAILDLKNATCVATKQLNKIESLSVLPDGALLVNSESICSIQENNIIMNKDQRFEKDFSTHGDRFDLGDCKYIPLQDKSGFIYFTSWDQSTVKMITNEFKVKAQLQLGPNNNPNHISFMSLTPSKYSTIEHLAPVSQDYFACITRCEDKYFAARRSADTYRLHIARNDLSQSYKVDLHHLWPKSLIVLNDEYVAVVGQHEGKDYKKISIKVFNLKCQKVNKFIIDKDIYNHFVAATPDGQLVTCSKTGQIAIHTCIPSKEILRKEIESVLSDSKPMLMAKDLVSIVTNYAGLFSGNTEMPKETFEEINHPVQKPGIFSKLRSKF